MVERPLSMREVPGSIPGFSNPFPLFIFCFFFFGGGGTGGKGGGGSSLIIILKQCQRR